MTQTRHIKPTLPTDGNGLTEATAFNKLRSALGSIDAAIDTATEDYELILYTGLDADTTSADLEMSGTGGTARTLRIRAAGADRHSMTRSTGYRRPNARLFINNSNPNITVVLDGIAAQTITVRGTAGGKVQNCLAYDAPGAGLYCGGGTWTFENCGAYGCTTDGFQTDNEDNAPTVKWVNCSSLGNGGFGFARIQGTVSAINSVAGGNVSGPYTTSTMTKTNCAHDTATTIAGSTKSIAYSTANFANVTSGAQDGRLVLGSALIGIGVGPSSNASVPLFDFNDDARSGATTDIGFDQFADAPITSITLSITLQGENGAALASLTNIAAEIWYDDGINGTAPDQSESSLATNGAGLLSLSIDVVDQEDGDAVFVVLTHGTPPDQFHCGRYVPTYSFT